MIVRHAFLYAHLTGLMLLVGGVGASIACKAMALRTRSPESIGALLEAAPRAVRRYSMPGALLLFAAGTGLVLGSHGHYSFSDSWIAGTIALFVASSVLGARLHGPRTRRASALAAELADRNEPASDELHAIIRGGRPATVLDVGLLLGMVALMVFKPGS